MFLGSTFMSELVRKLGVRPRDISDFDYQQKVDADRCPNVAARRLIPADRKSAAKQVCTPKRKLTENTRA